MQVRGGYVTRPSYFFETFIRTAAPRVLAVKNPFPTFDHHETIDARLAVLEARPGRELTNILLDVLATLETACE